MSGASKKPLSCWTTGQFSMDCAKWLEANLSPMWKTLVLLSGYTTVSCGGIHFGIHESEWKCPHVKRRILGHENVLVL
jgi:hypothetical protein